ncbi:MAG: tetratricopeptide repeat protein, partial [Bacteroidetes bacterium]|nr:tetratricopeptide repeat protein [Bacteroidota bacterium]
QQFPHHPLAFQARLALGQHFYTRGEYDRTLNALQSVLDDEPPTEIAAKALYWMGAAALEQGRTAQALDYYQQVTDDYLYTETAPLAIYATAFIHVQQDDYDAAVEAFELLTARYPESPYARNIGLALAEVYYELGDYERVIEEVEKRLPRLDEEARERATFLQAEAYNQLRDSDNAILYYQRFTEQDPDSPYYRRALYGLAWNYYFEGVYEWAADRFAQVHAGHRDDLAMEGQYYEAVNRKLNGKPGVAAEQFGTVADRWPDGRLADRAVFEQGLTLYELRQWEKAHGAFSRLVDEYADSDLLGEALRLRGYTNIALNDFDTALEDFDRAVALDAAPPELKQEVLFQKAWLLYRTGAYDEAAEAFQDIHEETPGSPKASDARFWAAESRYQDGRLDAAEDGFEAYLEDHPTGRYVEAAHYALAWVYFRQNRYQEAISAFRTFLDDYRGADDAVPYRSDAMLRLADSHYALKQYPQAIEAYQQVGLSGGDYAQYQVGQAFYNAGDAFEAISAFRELLEAYPDSNWREEAQYTLAYLYFLNQDYDQAIASYQELIEAYPRDPLAAKAQYGIGDAHFNAGNLDAAIEAYSAVLERYPDSPFVSDAASSIQYALIGLDDADRAEALIADFAERNPNSRVVDELRFRRAEVLYQGGQSQQALTAFQDYLATANAPELRADAQYYVGVIQAEQDQPEASIEALQRAASASAGTHRADAAQRLGRLYLDQQQYEAALRTYRRLEQLSDDPARTAQAMYGQGIALVELGRPQEAEDLLTASLQDQSEDDAPPATLLGLARVYQSTGRPADAMRLYRDIANRSDDEAGAEALYRLGELLVDREEYEVAVSQLSRMPTLFSGFSEWVARSFLLQARAFRQLGQPGEAGRLYDRVVEQFPGTPYADTAEQEKARL